MSFWPTPVRCDGRADPTAHPPALRVLDDHWLRSAHQALLFGVPSDEWLALEYLDWKSGGDTNFAPLASADGQLDCRGFWDKGKTDKDALWTSNATVFFADPLRSYVVPSANFGRVK